MIFSRRDFRAVLAKGVIMRCGRKTGVWGWFGCGAALLALVVSLSPARAGEADLRELMARLAAQEALLAKQGAQLAEQAASMRDMQAKMAHDENRPVGSPRQVEGVLSIKKNAVVTVGGVASPVMYSYIAKVDSVYDEKGNDTGEYKRRIDAKHSNLSLSDSELFVKIDINDHLDAYLDIDLNNHSYGLTKRYYLRWKNILESGFGLKVGRDTIVFGETGYGYLSSHAMSYGDGIRMLKPEHFENFPGVTGRDNSIVPLHNIWHIKGVNQVTPYWESRDGKLVAEVSFMQNVDNTGSRRNLYDSRSYYIRDDNGVWKYRSINYGIGTMSARVRWSPTENLKLTFSAVNYRVNGVGYTNADSIGHARNNTATSLAFSYRPHFMQRLNIWTQWIHGWNVDNFKDLDSDAVNFGIGYDFTPRFNVFAQGDYVDSRYKYAGADNRGRGWASYIGAKYILGQGLSMEAGWKHETYKYTVNGRRTARVVGDTVYGNVSFEF